VAHDPVDGLSRRTGTPVDTMPTEPGTPRGSGTPAEPDLPADGTPADGTAAPDGTAGDDAAGSDAPPTIYDVARVAGVSIASVSRVLNGRRNPRPETRDRVQRAVAELGFIPDGAARALSARLKEVIGVVVRRSPTVGSVDDDDDGAFADEAESLLFTDVLNRGIERAAQLRGFDLLVRSVDVDDHDHGTRITALARKSDGLILHDRLLDPERLRTLSRQIPVVTLAGVATDTTANVRSDNATGMRDLARHLIIDHGYRSLAFLGGYGDSPDSLARQRALAEVAEEEGAILRAGAGWQGNYFASGGAAVIEALLAAGERLPRAIVCANDQTALGVVYVLRRHGIAVPGEVAVTGFDDIPMARHLHPRLTTVRQPIGELGETAFEVLFAMIGRQQPPDRDIVLPARLIRRESFGCETTPGA
jgi:LacI family transcriptional regulator